MKIRNYTLEDFKTQFEIARKQLNSLGYSEVMTNIYELKLNNKRINILGSCKKLSSNHVIITLNQTYANIEDINKINNTIMHELCHSIKDGHGHTGNWKVAINAVNSKYGYNISRKGTVSKPYLDMTMKYNIKCECGGSWGYARKTKIINHIAGGNRIYRCQLCGSESLTVVSLI